MRTSLRGCDTGYLDPQTTDPIGSTLSENLPKKNIAKTVQHFMHIMT